MAGEAFVAVFFIIVGVIIFLFFQDNITYRRMRANISQKLEVMGYDTQHMGGLVFGTLSGFHKNGQKIHVETYDEGSRNSRRTYFRIQYVDNTITPISFDLRSRESFSKAFGQNIANVAEFDNDFKLNSMHRNKVIEFFESEPIKNLFTSLKPHLRYITVSGKRLSIEIGLSLSEQPMIDAVVFCENVRDRIIFLNPQTEYVDFEEYVCYSCGKEIEFHGQICPNCKSPSPRCVICFTDPETDDMIIMFECCKSYAHYDHAQTWLRSSSECPYCGETDPDYGLVKALER